MFAGIMRSVENSRTPLIVLIISSFINMGLDVVFMDSFRTESVMEGTNIRTTTIYPSAIKTELLNAVAPSETKTAVEKFYKQAGIEPIAIANAVLYDISQPDNVDVSDLVIRPSRER